MGTKTLSLDLRTWWTPRLLLPLLLVSGALLWVYWPTLWELGLRWSYDAKYSHGYLVPLFSLYLLWARAPLFQPAAMRPALVSGLICLLAGLGLRLAGVYLFFPWFAETALLPIVAGLCLMLGGWSALRWAWPAILFLVFMVPLPAQLEVSLSGPLQRMATLASEYALQTLGFPAHSEGNVIVIRQVRIGVVEACNGLGMLMIFIALSVAVVLLSQRSWFDKVIVLLSAIPIALICNITRITVTGVLHVLVGKKLADLVFHDLAGWLMMPMALGLLWLELKLISWVIPEEKEDAPLHLVAGLAPAGVAPAAAAPPRPAPARRRGAKQPARR